MLAVVEGNRGRRVFRHARHSCGEMPQCKLEPERGAQQHMPRYIDQKPLFTRQTEASCVTAAAAVLRIIKDSCNLKVPIGSHWELQQPRWRNEVIRGAGVYLLWNVSSVTDTLWCDTLDGRE